MSRLKFAISLAERVLNTLASGTKIITPAAVFAMMAIVVCGVVARYVFTIPLVFPNEYAPFLMVAISVLGANWVLKEKGHIRVDFVIRMLSARVRAWLMVVTNIVSMFAVLIILVQSARLVSQTLASHTVTLTILATPIGIVQLLMPIGFGLLLIEFMRTTTISIKSAIFPTEPEE